MKNILFGTFILKSANWNKGSSCVPQTILVVCGPHGTFDLWVGSESRYERWHRCLTDRTGRSLSPPPSLSPTAAHPEPAPHLTSTRPPALAVRQSPPPHATFANHLFCFGFLYSSGFPPTLPRLDQESETSGNHFNALVVLCGCLSAMLFTFTLCIILKSHWRQSHRERWREWVIQSTPAKMMAFKVYASKHRISQIISKTRNGSVLDLLRQNYVFYIFEKSYLCLPSMHLSDKKYSIKKNNIIVKNY